MSAVVMPTAVARRPHALAPRAPSARAAEAASSRASRGIASAEIADPPAEGARGVVRARRNVRDVQRRHLVRRARRGFARRARAPRSAPETARVLGKTRARSVPIHEPREGVISQSRQTAQMFRPGAENSFESQTRTFAECEKDGSDPAPETHEFETGYQSVKSYTIQ